MNTAIPRPNGRSLSQTDILNNVYAGPSVKTQADSPYSILATADLGGIVEYGALSSAVGVFQLPVLSSASDGDVYRILNDSYHNLTVKPNAVDHVWNSGTGYGIEIVEKGTLVTIRGNFASKRWDILSKTGGKVLIEGLVLHESMRRGVTQYDANQSVGFGSSFDETGRGGKVRGNLGCLPESVPQLFGAAGYTFDGSSAYMQYIDSPDWDIFAAASGIVTISFQVYINVLRNYDVMMANNDNTNYWQWYTEADGTLTLTGGGTGALGFSSGTGAISGAVWQNVVLIVDNTLSTAGMYVQGVQKAYLASWTPISSLGSLFIGKGSSFFLAGLMQDLHISYNNPYNAAPDDMSGTIDSFTVPAAPFIGVM